jgi:Zn-dependent peptidase ImmA (M78 family)/DNA-binding XRE family transcriptional regulator
MEPSTALGARIRAFRERAGLKGQELAALIELDPSAVSNIERGKRSVKTDELGRIAEALNVSPLALLDDMSLPARMPIAPRGNDGANAAGTVYKRLLGLAELHTVLDQAGYGTHPRLKEAPAEGEDWLVSATRLADWVSERLNDEGRADDRFSALARAIENNLGVDVLVEAHPEDALAGAAITDEAFPLIFVNASQPTPRALFTLAHELAHVLTGHGETITLDRDLSAHSPSERFANAFAATLLMPEVEIRRAIDRYGRGAESLARMLQLFGVSFESLVYRLHNTRRIDARGRDNLRSLGLRGLIRELDRPEHKTSLDPQLQKSLIAQLGGRPERRPPGWLLDRAVKGYRDGTIGIRPLAGLLDADPDELLHRLHTSSDDSGLILADYTPVGSGPSDEELFEESPF